MLYIVLFFFDPQVEFFYTAFYKKQSPTNLNKVNLMLKGRVTRKRILLFLLLLFLLAASNYAGGVMGFYQGYDTAMYFRDSDAFSTSLALGKLRMGDYKGASNLLETRLDLEIIQCGDTSESYKSPYNIAWFLFRQSPEEAHGHLLSFVAQYRGNHPSPSTSPEVRQRVNEILLQASSGIESQK